ncbi:MAG: phosphoglycerate dehydrogenase [Chloroflexi bacterium]|nr:phosphoglycerate dehydrogenase [Chloroflexota bacterium]
MLDAVTAIPDRMHALVLAPFSDAARARLRARMDLTYESWLETNALQDPEALGERLAREHTGMLVVEADFVFEETLDAATDLRFIGVCRNALNHVDIDAATARGIAVSHARGRNTGAVAEMTLGLIIALARRIPEAHHFVSGGAWRDPAAGYRVLRGREVAGSTVGIVGFGQIGRAVAARCAALGARVVACDPLIPADDMRATGAGPLDLPSLLAESDFVTLHLPEDESTHHLFDAVTLARMNEGAYLINTGAGGAVDPAALADALNDGHLGGAALDVFASHPLPLASPLMSARNLILTPHIAGATAETIERHSMMITDDIERLLDGRALRHCVNPDYAAARAV